ncbi:unnamed protein product [Pleuronectes platessa]|uniref:Uncharacterized protein n=1 Tax=Pleuronectes platessa TaxID=8262 RepID=A0A9N7YCJ9_PLEPL|nr:unnamed protein product [Pleuronectes platessa]
MQLQVPTPYGCCRLTATAHLVLLQQASQLPRCQLIPESRQCATGSPDGQEAVGRFVTMTTIHLALPNSGCRKHITVGEGTVPVRGPLVGGRVVLYTDWHYLRLLLLLH